MLHFHIVTLFPESIEPYLSSSILGRAIKKKLIKISFYDPKDFAIGKPSSAKASQGRHNRVDQRPYGGGPGMVLEPNAMLRASQKALRRIRQAHRKRAQGKQVEKIFFATDGEQFDERMAKKLSRKKHILLISGRYEGVDARVYKILSARGGSAFGGKAKKVSVGPFVLTGGELPAATLIDAVARFVPGVLGKAESLERSRVSSPEVYTRPETLVWKGKKYKVPKVLLSGNHKNINEWKTKSRRFK